MKIEVNDFNLRDTILSGACFRVTEETDGSFTNILSDRVINIKQVTNTLIINSSNNENLKEIILEYLADCFFASPPFLPMVLKWFFLFSKA